MADLNLKKKMEEVFAEEDFTQFYFVIRPRSIITIPLFAVMCINVFYYVFMILMIEIDLFMGNFFIWLIFGQTVGVILGAMSVMVSFVPIMVLPYIWQKMNIWGIFKVALFPMIFMVSYFIAFLIQGVTFWILDIFVTLRTTLWWGELWAMW